MATEPKLDPNDFIVGARPYRLLWTYPDPGGAIGMLLLDPDHTMFEQNLRDMTPMQRDILLAYLTATSDAIYRVKSRTNAALAP